MEVHDGWVPAEIERKFRVRDEPDLTGAEPGTRLRQGYVALDGPVEVRIRITEAGSTLTVKGGSGLTRAEVEVGIGDDEARELWALSEGRRIEKVRHRIVLDDGLVAELDRFEGDLAGLSVVEVEFPNADDAAAFQPPEWFGEELTGHPGWSNAALAQGGRPA